jgi:hypothetical protein
MYAAGCCPYADNRGSRRVTVRQLNSPFSEVRKGCIDQSWDDVQCTSYCLPCNHLFKNIVTGSCIVKKKITSYPRGNTLRTGANFLQGFKVIDKECGTSC